ncbi:MAG: hypothetical protein WD226_00950, partial [Planctomycetota bacterium]
MLLFVRVSLLIVWFLGVPALGEQQDDDAPANASAVTQSAAQQPLQSSSLQSSSLQSPAAQDDVPEDEQGADDDEGDAADAPQEPEAPPEAAPRPINLEATLQLVWRGGRSPQPGLSKNRRAERARARLTQREELIAQTNASPEARAATVKLLRDLCDDASTPEPLLTAVLRTIGLLDLYELADVAVDCLDRTDRAASSACVALHALFGVWFESSDDARAFIASLGPGRAPDVYRERLRLHDERERALRLEVARLDPAAVRFDVPDPTLRADLARALVTGWGSVGGTERLELARTLGASAFQALRTERDVEAFHALLELMLTTLETGGETGAVWDELATFLDETLIARADERSLPIARAFARFPWRGLAANDGQSTDLGPEHGLARIGRALDGLRTRVRWPKTPDEDNVLGVLDALGSLCDRTRSADRAELLRDSGARAPVFALIEDATASPVQRAAAVSTLRRMVHPGDGPRLVRVLDGERDEPQLAHAILGCLGVLLTEFGTESAGAEEVLDRIARWAVDEDPDLRRQALNLLENCVEPLTAHVPVRLLLERLGNEELADLAATKLRLIGRLGDASLLPELLALESFDELVQSSPLVLEALTGALESLANGANETCFLVARRLLSVADETSRLTRLRRALALAGAHAGPENLGLDEHADLVEWAWQLHAAGLEVASAAPGFGERLTRVHLPALAAKTDQPLLTARAAHLEAILRAAPPKPDAKQDVKPDVPKIQALFESALTHGADNPQLTDLARRDRARFLALHGSPAEAIANFRALGDNDVLRNSDLRLAVELLEADVTNRPAHANEAFSFLWRLIQRPSWRSETTGVRWRDLEALATWADRAAQPQSLWLQLQSLLADLPPVSEVTPAAPPQASWFGLERDEGGLQRLRALALRAATGTRSASAPRDDKPPAPASPNAHGG